MTQLDWQINIENLAERVAKCFGTEVVLSAFRRFDATGIEDLDPSDYESVFSDLMLMDSDSD